MTGAVRSTATEAERMQSLVLRLLTFMAAGKLTQAAARGIYLDITSGDASIAQTIESLEAALPPL